MGYSPGLLGESHVVSWITLGDAYMPDNCSLPFSYFSKPMTSFFDRDNNYKLNHTKGGCPLVSGNLPQVVYDHQKEKVIVARRIHSDR